MSDALLLYSHPWNNTQLCKYALTNTWSTISFTWTMNLFYPNDNFPIVTYCLLWYKLNYDCSSTKKWKRKNAEYKNTVRWPMYGQANNSLLNSTLTFFVALLYYAYIITFVILYAMINGQSSPLNAFSSCAISILTICNMACMARPAASLSSSMSNRGKAWGTICQETPYLSFNHAH